MKDFTIFLGLTIKHLTGSVLGWSLNVITFIGIFATVQYTFFPAWVWIATILFNIFLATFLAWRGEKLKVAALETKLQEIKNVTPEYTLRDGDIKKYTIQSLIDTSAKEIDDLKQVAYSTSGSSGVSRLSHVFASLGRDISHVAPLRTTLGIESDEEKLERLKLYHKELQHYEEGLKDLYQINLSVESSRHDKNIEIEITSDDTDDMIVQDDYESASIPTTSSPSRHDLILDTAASHAHSQQVFSVAGKYYLQSDANDNQAMSELAYLNAAKPMDVFGSTFYIRSKKDKVELQIKIHSTKLSQPQILTKQIGLTGAPVLQIQETEDI